MFCHWYELACRIVVVDLQDVGGANHIRKVRKYGGYARIRLCDEDDRKEQKMARRTDVGLCADTTYAILCDRKGEETGDGLQGELRRAIDDDASRRRRIPTK